MYLHLCLYMYSKFKQIGSPPEPLHLVLVWPITILIGSLIRD